MSDRLGGSLGRAHGTVRIDAELESARGQINTFASETERVMGRVANATKRADAEFNAVRRGLSQLASGFGLSLSVAGAVQLGKAAIASAEAATAYNRQEVAAVRLAGSQARLNELLDAYAKASGGVVDDATALLNVTRLQATGFAKSAEQVERFVRATRGASIALGKPQDYIIQETQLAISNTSQKRLDQIGLGIAEVTQRISELRAANQGWTREMAFQEAVLGLLEAKYGALSESVEGQKTGLEKAAIAAANFGLQFGQIIGPTLNLIGDAFAKDLERWVNGMKAFIALTEQAVDKLREMGIVGPDLTGSLASRTSIGSNVRNPPLEIPRFKEEQLDAIRDWSEGVQDIERQAASDRLDATRQYESQRSSTIRDYEKSIAREAQDFALARLRAEQDLAKSILSIRSNASLREAAQAEDLSRNLAQARGDSDERIADARKDANERIAEMEEDYARNRARAQEDHRDKLMSAAGRLDAIAILEERKRFARQSSDAKEAHDDQRKDLQKQLDERIEDERKTLDKSTRQAQEAHDRQLEDARKADEQRIADMQADFELRKAREDEDRGIRLERMAVDHNDQLAEMARAHSDRMAQIATHAQEERTQLDTEFRKQLEDLGIQTDAWIAKQQRITDAAIAEFDRWWAHLRENVTAIQGPPSRPLNDNGGWPSLANPRVFPSTVPAAVSTNSSRSITLGDIHVSIGGTTNASAADIAWLVRQEVVTILEEVAA